jgi:molybdopterin/thiamine biosynthesis adenylyltransferase
MDMRDSSLAHSQQGTTLNQLRIIATGMKEAELERYSRQIMLFGEEGQKRLKETRVLIAGAGGLGSAISIYLAAAGFGYIRIVDCDLVDRSNLNRQVLHWTENVGKSKAESALETLEGLNPEIEVEAIRARIDEENVEQLVEGCQMIMDAMDNFKARYMLNRASLEGRYPIFHGAISGFHGQATTLIPGRTACLRCLFPRAPEAQTFPALGSTCGVVGSIQATEAIKFVLGKGELLLNRLLLWDGLSSRLDEIVFQGCPGCPDCHRYQCQKQDKDR